LTPSQRRLRVPGMRSMRWPSGAAVPGLTGVLPPGGGPGKGAPRPGRGRKRSVRRHFCKSPEADVMGSTRAERGRLAALARIEDLEDRLLDFALEVGGMAQIWRTQADNDPGRVVRGVILQLAPGQESTSLVVSPEGWLVGLTDIEDAECGRLTEPP